MKKWLLNTKDNMRIAELLHAMASWLESPNNEAMLLAETNANCMKIVAESCILAAELLKVAAEEVDVLEDPAESLITAESIDETAALASTLDGSNDPQLKKMAAVLDELLLTISAPKNASAEKRAIENDRIEQLKKKYQQPREELKEYNRISESEKGINKSNMTKEYKIESAPLSARSCPQHPGAQLSRIGEHRWQCELDHKVYDFETGFSLDDGTKIPGGDVANQTQNTNRNYYSMFDTRQERLGYGQE